MKYIKYRVAAIIIAATLMAGSLTAPVTASNIGTSGGTYAIPAEVTAAAATFSVTLPTSIPIQVKADGSVVSATNLEVANNSSGPVIVNDVSTAGKNGWAVVEFEKDYANSKVGLKEIGLSLNNSETAGPGSLTLGEADWTSINSQGTLGISCEATVAPQYTSVTEQIADIVFTVGWLSADGESGEGGDSLPVLGAETFSVDKSTGLLEFTGTFDVLSEYLSKSSGVLTMPSEVEGTAVTGMADIAYGTLDELDSLGTPLKKLVMPNNDTFNTVGQLSLGDSIVEVDLGSATQLADSLLGGHSSLEKVVLHGTVKTIPDMAFKRCTNLSSIDLDGVTELGSQAFMQSDALPKDVLTDSIRIIGDYCFNGGGGDQAPELIVPLGVESIGAYAFGGHKIYYNGDLKDSSGYNWGATEIVGRLEGLSLTPDNLVIAVGQQAFVIVQKLPSGTTDTTRIIVDNQSPEIISVNSGSGSTGTSVGISGIKAGSGLVSVKCGNIIRTIGVTVTPN